MTRQQLRAQERHKQQMADRIDAFRKTNPLADATYQAGYEMGWHVALAAAMKTCYAASVLALHDLEGYGEIRNVRFLQAMDEYVTTALTSEDIIDEALEKAGVRINFKEVFSDDRVQRKEGR